VQAARFGSMAKYRARHSAVQDCRFASQFAADCAAAGATVAAEARIANANVVRRMI